MYMCIEIVLFSLGKQTITSRIWNWIKGKRLNPSGSSGCPGALYTIPPEQLNAVSNFEALKRKLEFHLNGIKEVFEEAIIRTGIRASHCLVALLQPASPRCLVAGPLALVVRVGTSDGELVGMV